NELAVHDTMNALTRSGARVLHQDNEAVHVSGHGSAEELKMMLALVHPKAFMPVHGELRMLAAHAALAESVGVPTGRIYVCDNGDVLVLERGSVRREGMVEAGVVFVDGLGIGDPKDAVLRDRRQLSADGTLIVVCQLHRGPSRVEPEVIARGFAPEGADAADELLDEVRAHASTILDRLDADGVREHKLLQSHLHDELAELVWNRARKRPLVLPVVVVEPGSGLRVAEVLTIGAYGWDAETFFDALVRERVGVFCDLRRRRGVRGPEYAFANSARLQQRLEELGIAYRHRLDLAPSTAIRQAQYGVDESMGVGKRNRSQLSPAFEAAYAAECLSGFDA